MVRYRKAMWHYDILVKEKLFAWKKVLTKLAGRVIILRHLRECWNGRQARLRCVWSTPCGFESHLSHQKIQIPLGVSGFFIALMGLERPYKNMPDSLVGMWAVLKQVLCSAFSFFHRKRFFQEMHPIFPQFPPFCKIWRKETVFWYFLQLFFIVNIPFFLFFPYAFFDTKPVFLTFLGMLSTVSTGFSTDFSGVFNVELRRISSTTVIYELFLSYLKTKFWTFIELFDICKNYIAKK